MIEHLRTLSNPKAAPNVRLDDMAQEAMVKNTNMILISQDQQKVFDRVNWGFLFEIMKHVNYGPNFMKWLQQIAALLIMNGCLIQLI